MRWYVFVSQQWRKVKEGKFSKTKGDSTHNLTTIRTQTVRYSLDWHFQKTTSAGFLLALVLNKSSLWIVYAKRYFYTPRNKYYTTAFSFVICKALKIIVIEKDILLTNWLQTNSTNFIPYDFHSQNRISYYFKFLYLGTCGLHRSICIFSIFKTKSLERPLSKYVFLLFLAL